MSAGEESGRFFGKPGFARPAMDDFEPGIARMAAR